MTAATAEAAARPQQGFIALHGTTSAIVPADETPVTLKPAAHHGQAAVWPDDIAPRNFLYLGEYVTMCFAHHRAQSDGHLPMLAQVEAPVASLHPDPAWFSTAETAAKAGGLTWPPPDGLGMSYKESWEDCGRMACDSEVKVTKRFVCHDAGRLGQLLAESGLSRFVLGWVQADLWWPPLFRAWQPGLPVGASHYPKCRELAGSWVFQACFDPV